MPCSSDKPAILFDMDGTLIESVVAWYHILNDACDHFGTPRFELDLYRRLFGQSQQTNVDMFFPGKTVVELDAFCDKTFATHTDKIFELEGAYEVAKLAHELTDNNCFIVTNSPPEVVDQLLQRPETLPLLQLFGRSRIFGAGEILPDGTKISAKPEPQMLHLAAKALGADISNCIMVGDSKFDVMAGRAAGCKTTVGINVDADVRIASIHELKDHLSGLLSAAPHVA